jgi:hypothetical protein
MAITVYTQDYMLDNLITNKTLYVAASSSTNDDLQNNGRQLLTFANPSSGGSVTGTVPDLVIPAGNTVATIKVYDDLVAGEVILTHELGTPEPYANEGSLSIDTITIQVS